MDFLIPSKKVSKCPECKGSGYKPLENDNQSLTREISIEIGCNKCNGRGKVTKRVDLSLESLKDLLK